MEAPDLASLRREDQTAGLRRSDLHPDPLEQFSAWFAAAVEAALPDVNAIALATSTPEGKPSVRIVLLKGFDQRGFIFFTNYRSQKGRELDANPQAAFTIFWVQLERQIRVAGRVGELRATNRSPIFIRGRAGASSARGSRNRAR